MDQAKSDNVINAFFNSLKTEDDKMLETGLTHNTTVEVLRQAVLGVVQEQPESFEKYVKFFEEGCMYLQDESDEVPEVDKNE